MNKVPLNHLLKIGAETLSTIAQTLSGAINEIMSLKGAANGLAELDATGRVPSTQLPSYVDDVLEYADLSSFPVTGESGKIYVALDTNKTYRWSGTAYVEISESLALGETASTAYAGDKGKTNADNIAVLQGNIVDINTELSKKNSIIRYGTTGSANTGYYLITINSNTSWMLCFSLTLYQYYRATKLLISGYNYNTNHWYSPSAIIMADSSNTTLPVYFGYTDTWNLWVAVPRNYYTGMNISDVANGYTQVDNFEDLFTIEPVSSLPGTLQSTITATTSKIGIGNGTLTIQKNGSNVATFTANQSGNTIANITVPAPTLYVTTFSSAAVTFTADDYTTITVSGISVSGYTPVLAFYASNNMSNKYVVPTRLVNTVSSGSATFTIRNLKSSAYSSGKITIYVLFKKDIS